jgi:division protein CdvB (Snf7/Vps24/ESCRT-III family)
MNIEQISNVMNQFEEKFEDLDVATSTVEASIDKVRTLRAT